MERWATIDNFPNYMISDYGRVYSIKWDKIMKQKLDRYGYYTITLSNNGERKYPTIHRLVGKAFIKNPDNLPQINHIDSNRTNNFYKNLEWCDVLHNNRHSWKNGRKATWLGKSGDKSYTSIKIKIYDKDSNYIETVHGVR